MRGSNRPLESRDVDLESGAEVNGEILSGPCAEAGPASCAWYHPPLHCSVTNPLNRWPLVRRALDVTKKEVSPVRHGRDTEYLALDPMPGKRRIHPRRFKTLPQDTEAAVWTAPVFGARRERPTSADEELAHGFK